MGAFIAHPCFARCACCARRVQEVISTLGDAAGEGEEEPAEGKKKKEKKEKKKRKAAEEEAAAAEPAAPAAAAEGGRKCRGLVGVARPRGVYASMLCLGRCTD